MNSCIYSGFQWLTRSGIQRSSGGASRFYQTEASKYASISTAATSYFVSGLLQSSEVDPDAAVECAQAAGRFLLDRAFDEDVGLFRHEVVEEGNLHPWSYLLDSTAGVRALIDLWKATQEPTYAEQAERCGIAIKVNLSRMDGSFFPVFDLARHKPYEADEKWWQQPGVYHLKSALAFRLLADVVGLSEFKAMSDDLLQWCLKRHEGFAEPEPTAEMTMSRLHAYCYFLEGLLPKAGLDPDCSRALQFGILEIENLSQDVGHEFQRCDVLAQLLRLRLFADRLGIMELDYQQAGNEAAAIEEFQRQSSDPKIDGGFAFARKDSRLTPDGNTTATIFSLQALQMWEQASAGGFRQSWEALI